jgi:hypothetical protein
MVFTVNRSGWLFAVIASGVGVSFQKIYMMAEKSFALFVQHSRS